MMLELKGLNLVFGRELSKNHAVKDVSFSVAPGESLGLVGESGSGKSTVINCISGLHNNWTGKIAVEGKAVDKKRGLNFYQKVQMVFQDPYGSLHPRHTIDTTLKEPLAIHRRNDINERVEKALAEVGLDARFRFRYPHQLSGGQRQRVAIARALILEPELLLLDEPTSALDVSVQAEVLNLLQDIRAARGLTYVLVSHDLAVVSHMCDTILVMKKGAVIEKINRTQLVEGKLKEKYTRQLMVAGKGYDRDAIDRFEDY